MYAGMAGLKTNQPGISIAQNPKGVTGLNTVTPKGYDPEGVEEFLFCLL